MSGQRFIARDRRMFGNGAVGWAPGGPFDCLGPYAKVENCPIVALEKHNGQTVKVDTGKRRTCYATGLADTFFSVPARAQVSGKRVRGFFTNDGGTWRHADGSLHFVASSDATGCVFIVCADET